MKTWIIRCVLVAMLGSMLGGCASSRLGKKRGCQTTTSSMGAERVLAGEKADKKQKFKIKGMN